MAYQTIKKGSSGSSVSELQKLLNQNGYSLDVDGVFGSKTQAAVRDYQRKNNLSVDGIAGSKTWGALTGSKSTTPKKSTADWLAEYEGNRPVYQQSQAVTDAENLLKQYEGKKPGEYQSSYQEQIDQLLNQILNREQFSYDPNADPLYRQYADQYQQRGQTAMMDTMGQAAALTGGYGNTYAQTAGQQMYQGYLQELNNIIPELRNTAYQMYLNEGDQLRNNLGILQGLDESDYGKYRDTVADYYNDLNYYYNKYSDMSASDYNKYANDLAAWQADRDYWYTKQQDEQAQANWQKEFDMAAAAAKKSSGGSSRSSSSSKKRSSSSKKNNEEDDDAIYLTDPSVDELNLAIMNNPGKMIVSTVNRSDGRKQRVMYRNGQLFDSYTE